MDHRMMIKWAYRLRMEGRKYAVEAQRLLLFYLILNDQPLHDYLERLEVLIPNKRWGSVKGECTAQLNHC